MEYLKIRNWGEFQHYKDREPKWIKIYRSLLVDYDFEQLTDAEFGALVKIWLLASQLGNKVPNDPSFIQRKCGLSSKPNIDKYLQLRFLVLYQSVQNDTDTPKVLAPREDKIREEKKEAEYPEWLDRFLWKEYKIYRTAIKSPLTPFAEQLSLTALKEQMDAGYKQSDVINQTIQSGKWKSFFPVKNKQAEKTYPVSDFGDDLFLKQAFEFLGPGYTDDDFRNHCLAFGHEPSVIRAKIKRIREV